MNNEAEEFEFALALEKERAGQKRPPGVSETTGNLLRAAGAAAPAVAKDVFKTVRDIGSGALEGFTYGTNSIDKGGNIVNAPGEPAAIPGSIMNVKGGANKGFLEDHFTPSSRNFGRAIGGLIPLIVSELTAGAPAEALALKYGMGPVRTAMNKAGVTLATYETMKGAQQNKPLLETAGDAASGYMVGLPLGAASYGAGKALDWMTNNAPEGVANQYLNTPPKIADSLKDKGKPSLGRQFLDKTNYGPGTSKDAQYRNILGKLEDNRMLIKNKLEQADAALSTPRESPVPPGGRLLEYKPSGSTELNPQDLSSQFPYTGTTRSGYSAGLKGERSSLPNKVFTPQPGGATYDTMIPGKGVPADYAGTTREPTFPPSNIRSMEQSLGEVKNQPWPQRGGIDLDEVRAASGNVEAEQADIGKAIAPVSLGSPGERIVSNARAFDLLTKLDAEVNTAYQAVDKNTIPPGTEARAAMANRLREMLRQSVPEVSELLGQNHSLQLFETSLLPQVSGRAPISRGGDWMKGAAAKTLGSRVGLGAARAIGSAPVEAIAENIVKPTAKATAQLGLADYIERRSNGRKR